ncbi:cation-translocating P-type ATPase C-terminal domain-containing protein [Streptococcus uberis]|nr:cation transporting ATPase C-terminal domain-containing protein [Streptococcus uberis]MCK1202471.1 cation-translocating P-type ATPase C-terminal domain-containing protein [Streptococcus uberis]
MIGFFVTYWTSQGHLNHLAASGSHYKEATTMTLGAIIFANKLITSGILLEIAIFIALTDTPFLQKIFNTVPLELVHWLYLLACPFLMMAMEETRMRLQKK